MPEEKPKKRKLPKIEEVRTTVPIRIPRYLRDEILSQARRESGTYTRKAPARVLLERLDPEVAEKFRGIPSSRR